MIVVFFVTVITVNNAQAEAQLFWGVWLVQSKHLSDQDVFKTVCRDYLFYIPCHSFQETQINVLGVTE